MSDSAITNNVQTSDHHQFDAVISLIGDHPLTGVAGAIAAGVAAAMALPSSDAEERAMSMLKTSIATMGSSARVVGTDHLAEMGLTSTAIRGVGMSLMTGVIKSFLSAPGQADTAPSRQNDSSIA